jgi:AcrR family transcriptional regulator
MTEYAANLPIERGNDQKERAATKERILVAAADIFADRGYHATTVRAISDAAGANLAAVNYHFGSKVGLYRAILQQALSSLEAVLDELSRKDVELKADADLEAFARSVVSAFIGSTYALGPRGLLIRLVAWELIGSLKARLDGEPAPTEEIARILAANMPASIPILYRPVIAAWLFGQCLVLAAPSVNLDDAFVERLTSLMVRGLSGLAPATSAVQPLRS